MSVIAAPQTWALQPTSPCVMSQCCCCRGPFLVGGQSSRAITERLVEVQVTLETRSQQLSGSSSYLCHFTCDHLIALSQYDHLILSNKWHSQMTKTKQNRWTEWMTYLRMNSLWQWVCTEMVKWFPGWNEMTLPLITINEWSTLILVLLAWQLFSIFNVI